MKKTKKLIVGLGLALLGSFAHAQNGLENVTVEKYYVTTAADATQADADIDQYNADNGTSLPHGALPVGSVTYRIYADMLPGYQLLSVYADGTKSQSLVFTSTTPFYNNPNGQESPVPGTAKTAIKNNLLALDTYYSLGAVCTNNSGILKSEDPGGTGTNAINVTVAGNTGGVLLNNNAADMPIPLTTQDGMVATAGYQAPSTAGFTTAHSDFFNNGSVLSNSFVLPDGSWGNPSGAVGPVAATNKVLIGQFTTNGHFHYELNILIKSPAGNGEFYATHPAGSDLTAPGITGDFGPNTPPTATLTSPSNGANLVTGSSVTVTATAADLDGTVSSVQFFVDGASIGTDATSPYSATWTATPVGSHTITATATDNGGAQASDSHVVTVVANPPPVVTFNSPTTGSSVIAPDVVVLNVNATDNVSVAQVEFFDGATSLGVITTPGPTYTVSWTSSLGVHTLKATATDNQGATASSSISVTGIPNPPPTVSITSPANGASFFAPAVVTINATAADNESVVSVEFFVNGVSIGVDNSAPFSMTWPSVIGAAHLTAKATDNRGAQTTSSIVTIDIQDASQNYKVGSITTTCLPSGFCLPIIATYTVTGGVVGYDIVLHYNAAKVKPDAIGTAATITKSGDLLDASKYDVASYIDTANANINITAYINSSASVSDNFHGLPGAQLFCVAFSKKAAFQSSDTAVFSATLNETFYTSQSVKQVANGKYISYKDTTFNGKLVSWNTGTPIKYNSSMPGDYLVTNITNCSATSTAVNPDTLGIFHYNIKNGLGITISKDILGDANPLNPHTSVFPVIGGNDQYKTAQVAIGDPSFVPTIYQFIAMDVNEDGLVNSSDIAQIGQRSVANLTQYMQVGPQRDWTFVSPDLLATPAYQPGGFSKSNVPLVPLCLTIPVSDLAACPSIGNSTYTGILLGDVDGSYNPDTKGTNLKVAPDKVVFDLENAVSKDGYLDIPVSVESRNTVHALDFAMQFNNGNLQYNSIVTHGKLQTSDRFDVTDNTLRVASYSLEKYDIAKSVVSVRFAVLNGNVSKSDLTSLTAYVNGERAQVATKGSVSTLGANQVSVFPNPANGTLFIEAAEQSNVQLFDMNGKVVLETRVNANETQAINVQDIASGVYMMKIYNDGSVSTQKVVINK